MDYKLTIRDIKKNLDELRTEGLPLFRFIENIEQTCFSLEDYRDPELCPIEEISTFEADLESHFSRDEDAVCIPMNNPNLLYFLMGGNCRLASNNTYMSRLINVKPTSSKFYDILINDLVNWKLSTGEDGKQQFVDCRKTGVPAGAVSMIDYIVQENEHIISRFCGQESQEALRKLLNDYALNICEAESKKPDWVASLKSVPARQIIIIDESLVKKLAVFLDLSAKMADATQDRGEQPKYLAQGLTWLLLASLLRGKLSSFRGELDKAINSTYQSANGVSRITTETLDGNIATHMSEFEISQIYRCHSLIKKYLHSDDIEDPDEYSKLLVGLNDLKSFISYSIYERIMSFVENRIGIITEQYEELFITPMLDSGVGYINNEGNYSLRSSEEAEKVIANFYKTIFDIENEFDMFIADLLTKKT